MPNMPKKPEGIFSGIPLPGQNNMARMPKRARDAEEARINVSAATPPTDVAVTGSQLPQLPYTPPSSAPAPPSSEYGQINAPLVAMTPKEWEEWWKNPMLPTRPESKTPPTSPWANWAMGVIHDLMMPSPDWEAERRQAFNDIAVQGALARRRLANQMAGTGFGGSTGFLAQSAAQLQEEEALRQQALASINAKRRLYDLQRKAAAIELLKSMMGVEAQRELGYLDHAIKSEMAYLQAMSIAADLYVNAAMMKHDKAWISRYEFAETIDKIMNPGKVEGS